MKIRLDDLLEDNNEIRHKFTNLLDSFQQFILLQEQ